MLEARRTRTRTTPPAEEDIEVRIVRPRHGTAQAHAAMSPVLLSAGQTVSIEIEVRALIVKGNMLEADLLLWVENAINNYHAFRMGYVGHGAFAGIKKPRVRKAR